MSLKPNRNNILISVLRLLYNFVHMKAGYKMQTREERGPRLLFAGLGTPLGEASMLTGDVRVDYVSVFKTRSISSAR